MGSRSRALPRVATTKLTLITAALALFILWMPLQTPVALIVYQYGNNLVLARALLLIKDVGAALLILLLAAGYWRRVRLHWYDWAAIAYGALLAIYSIVPWLLGSHLSVLSVVASAREYGLPIELYAMGRLAAVAGVNVRWLIKWFLAVAAVSAAWTVFEYFFLPVTFWSSTMNMVNFVRDVQAVPGAKSLGAISIVAQYGAGKAANFPRAIGPFTHPVGTAQFFVLPLLLSVALAFESLNRGKARDAALLAGLSLLFAGAVITPISRGSWISVGVGMLILAVVYRRPAFSIAAVALTGALLLSVQPYTYAITSAIDQTDTSTVGHTEAIQKGTSVVSKNPLGVGVGQADQFGQVFSGGEGGTGENMYLALLVSVGPIGLLAFLVFLAGMMWRLAPVRFRAPPTMWLTMGTAAAMLGYIASSMFSSSLMRFTSAADTWLILGLAVAYVVAQRDGAGEKAEKDEGVDGTASEERTEAIVAGA